MKLPCVVLFMSLIAMSAAQLRPPHPHPQSICQADQQCKQRFGQYCFCLNTKGQQFGECICNMDPNILNECSKNSDCDGKVDNWNGHRLCGCLNISNLNDKGHCGCINPVG